jgi:hypothetical protein
MTSRLALQKILKGIQHSKEEAKYNQEKIWERINFNR